MAEEIRRQALIALGEADLTVMVVDARAGLRAGDECRRASWCAAAR